MIKALSLAVAQLSDRRILLLLSKVVVISLLLFVLLGIGVYFGLVWLFAWLGWNDGGFAAAAAAAIIGLLSAILLFRIIAVAVLNIFSDEVVDAVERRHYPYRAAMARPPGYVVGLRMGLSSAGRALGYNLLALPVYLLLMFTAGIGTALAFMVVNALLLGRDLQDMVAARHSPDPPVIDDEWRLDPARRFGAGLVTTLLFSVPFANLLAPIIGAAMATHMVHQQREERSS